MRRILVMTVLAVLALAGPAQAKVAAELYLSGEGLDLHLVSDQVYEYPELGGFVGPRTPLPQPEGKLGPRFTIRFVLMGGGLPAREYRLDEYRLPARHGEVWLEVEQYLYPHAEKEPVIYTPANQRWATGRDGIVPSGWARAEPLLIEWLEREGLPPRPEDPAAGAEPAPASGGRAVLWALLVLGSLLVVGAYAGRRARRAAVAR
jgi:hypothetical protein